MKPLLLLLLLVLPVLPCAAHEVRPAYFSLTEMEPGTFSAVWKVPARGGPQLAGDEIEHPPDPVPQDKGPPQTMPCGCPAPTAALRMWSSESAGSPAFTTRSCGLWNGRFTTPPTKFCAMSRVEKRASKFAVTPPGWWQCEQFESRYDRTRWSSEACGSCGSTDRGSAAGSRPPNDVPKMPSAFHVSSWFAMRPVCG